MRTIILGLTALFLMACSTIQTPQHAGPTTVFVVTARPPDAATPTSVPTITPTPKPTLARDPERGKVRLTEKMVWSCASAIAIMFYGACSSIEELIPPEVAGHEEQWPLPNKDYASTRAAFGATISSKNVDRLGVAWSFRIPGSGMFGAAATNPIRSRA